MKTSFLKQPRRDKLSATPHKRSAVVAIFLTAVTLTLAFLTTACDPAYTEETLHGYSKSKAARDAALIRIGSGTAVTNKHTGERLSLSIRWNESAENEETAP